MDIFASFQAVADFAAAANQAANLFRQAARMPDSCLTGLSLCDRNPEVINQLLPLFRGFYRHYFRVKTDGWEYIPKTGKVLLVGSHNGGLAAPDTVMMAYDWFRYLGIERPAYGLMDSRMWQVFPGVARLACQVGAIQATSSMAVHALRQEACVLIYPGGIQDVFRPHALRDRIHFQNDHRFIKLALLEKAPIVPVISYGAHDTLWVLADLYPQLQQLHQWGMPWPGGVDPGACPVYLGLPWGLSVGPLPNIPLPIPLHTRVCPPIGFDRYGSAAAHDDAYVEHCYQRVCQKMQADLDQLFAEHEG